jgi:hypothetical protein
MRGIAAWVVRGITGCVGGVIVAACGGSTPPPDTPAANAAAATPPASSASAPAAVASAVAAPAAPAAPAASTAAADPDPPLDDPNEQPGPIAMAPEFDKKKAKVSFPKKAKPDGQCWSQVSATGDNAKDFDAIVAACGTPTGLVEYAKPVQGKLHHKHDPVDVFTMPVFAGYCYRYFAIADASISDLDLLIEKKGGALVGDDKTNSPFAIIDTEQPWCQDEDQNLEFHVKVDGPGKGGYTFGVWARPQH